MSVWSGKRVFITGATGFIGANLVRRLLSSGAKLHVLTRPSSDWQRLADCRQQLSDHQVDLLDGDALCRLLSAIKPDCVFHLASYGSSSWDDDANTIIDVTCRGIVNLIAACETANCPVLVNAGTSSEYGFCHSPPAEDAPLNPNSTYAAAKAFATHCCQLAGRSGKLHAPTARLYSVYGPWESTRRFVPALLSAVLDDEWPPLVNPAVARDFVYVDDAVDALLAIATHTALSPDAVYNVGTGVQTTIGDAVALAASLCPVAAEPVWGSMPDRKWDTTCWLADSRRAQTAFAWHPRPFADGLKLTLDWLRQHPDWR